MVLHSNVLGLVAWLDQVQAKARPKNYGLVSEIIKIMMQIVSLCLTRMIQAIATYNWRMYIASASHKVYVSGVVS